jgi:hypothetical protein
MQFCQQPPSIKAILPHHDDLLFFVYWNDLSKTKGSRIFARRKLKSKSSGGDNTINTPLSDLPLDLAWNSPIAADIDWRSSLLLNIVLQTQYLLTVIRCPPGELDRLLDNNGNPSKRQNRSAVENSQSTQSRQSVIYVTKRVHASPSTTPVNLDQTKSSDSAPSISYPNICFAVDDFVEAFDCLILEDPQDCYCVVVHADVANTWSKAAALNTVDLHQKNREEEKKLPETSVVEDAEQVETLEAAAFEESLQLHTSPSRSPLTNPSLEETISVFNGYVNCKQLSTAVGSYLNSSPLKMLLQQRKQRGSRSQNKTAKVVMRGPGGIGSAEVAVTALHSDNQAKETPSTLETVLKNAVTAVKKAVQVEEERASSNDEEAILKLQCALMAVNIPGEALAEHILKAV